MFYFVIQFFHPRCVIKTDLQACEKLTSKNLNASVVLEDENIKEIAFQKFKILKEKMSDKLFHCYQSEEIDVFLEDYVFYSKFTEKPFKKFGNQ